MTKDHAFRVRLSDDDLQAFARWREILDVPTNAAVLNILIHADEGEPPQCQHWGCLRAARGSLEPPRGK